MSDEGPRNGWHWWKWGAELLGTAILLFAVVTAKDWAVRVGPPISDLEIRICIVGSVAGLVVIAIAFSRMGSGWRPRVALPPDANMSTVSTGATGESIVANA